MQLYSYEASANCLKVRVLLRLLNIECTLVETDIFDGATLTPAFAEKNALREVPVLELDDGTCIVQSSAILQYLADGTPWAGGSSVERAQATAWMFLEQEQVMPGIGGVRFRLVTGRTPSAELESRRAVGRGVLALIDDHLDGRDWLVGDAPTIADISIWAYAHLAPDAGIALPPRVAAWCARLQALPGFVDDLVDYPANARPGAGRSIYG